MLPKENGTKTMRWTFILIEICILYYNKDQQYSYHQDHWTVMIRGKSGKL